MYSRIFPIFFSRLLLIPVIVLALISQVGWAKINYEGKIVEEIRMDEDTDIQVSLDQIKLFLRFKEGDLLTKKLLRRSLTRLIRANFIEDVKFDVSEGETGVIVTLIVKGQVEIDDILTVGNEIFNDVSILEDVKAEDRQYFVRSTMNSIKFKMIRKYLEKGYHDVKIDYIHEPSEEEPGKVIVTFLIHEGPAYLVKAINFTGNSNVESDEIKNFLQTKEDTWYSTAIFNPSLFETDKQRILYALRIFGYYNAKIKNIDYSYEWVDTETKEKKYVIIDVEVEEGELHHFGKVIIKGNTLFSEEELTFDFQRVEGEPFNQLIHDQDLQSVYKKYQHNGYIFARLTPEATVVKTRVYGERVVSNVLDFTFDIYEGDKAHIEKIFIRGLTKTDVRVVERELRVREGETFDVDRINLSLYRLQRLDFFSEINKDYRTGSAEGLMNLNIILKDKATGKLSGGFTYGFSSGFSLIADFSDRNFLGQGYNFAAKASYGFVNKDLSVSFTEPWLLNEPVSLGGSFTIGKYYISHQQTLFPTNSSGGTESVSTPDGGDAGWANNSTSAIQYTRDKIGMAVFSGQRYIDWLEFYESFGVEFTHEYLATDTLWPENYSQLAMYNANSNLFSTPPPIDDGWKTTFILTLGISRDTRNSTFNPTEGLYHSLRTKLYFGSFRYSEWIFKNAMYTTVGYRNTAFKNILFKLTFAYQNEIKTLGRPLIGDYVNNSYYSLGENELRGWTYTDIYQFRTDRFGSDALINDLAYFSSYIMHTFEIRQNIATDFVQLSVYLNFAGVSHEKLSAFHPNSWSHLFNPKDFMYSTGFGLRINFPQLPIRFYWGWKFVYDPIAEDLVLFNHGDDYTPNLTFDIQGAF